MASFLKMTQNFLTQMCKSRLSFPKYRRTQSYATDSECQVCVNVPPTRCTTLESGFRVVSEDWGTPTATLGLFIDAGSRNESDKNNGVSNFIEHMAFKGTESRSKGQLETEIELMGAKLSSYTSREHTVFYAKCLASDVPKIIDILLDVVLRTKLDDEDIERERGVILRELQEVESNLQEVVFDYLHMVAYQGTPLANTAIGTTNNIRCLCAKDLRDFQKNFYTPTRMVLAAAGGVCHEELAELTECYLGKVCPKEDDFCLNPCRFTGSEIRVREDDIPLAHVTIAVESVGCDHPDLLPLMVASTLLGAWDRSQAGSKQNAMNLARWSEDEFLCHRYQSFNIAYKDTGLWGMYFVSGAMKIDDMMYCIQQEFMRLCTAVTQADVERAKTLLITNILFKLETSTGVCKDIGRQFISSGNRIPPKQLIEDISCITASKLRNVCYQYLYDRCIALAGVGSVEQLPDYNRVRNQMYWLRV